LKILAKIAAVGGVLKRALNCPRLRSENQSGPLIQEGRLLVLSKPGRTITHDEIEAELDHIRSGVRE